ncbi:MAG: bifunctional (p)ppGpp synthetase/guanosine-3',5'-bis(diphosphate) 3'-pyrophosphohydrolase [Candidatus Promineofilum sp.]|nr:bifunctional (p)ppGpp synthetase/guanosine-3',5'-bis(diphosphate) 3'-pyrophosphohydrolase [Promineifilum sp.]
MVQAVESTQADLLKGLPGSQSSDADRARLSKAIQFAMEAHGDKRRPSGETYFEHGRNVAIALGELGIDDPDTAVAALLHDIFLPHTGIAEATLTRQFGSEVTSLVKSIQILSEHSRQAGRTNPANDIVTEMAQNRDTLEAIRKALLSIIEGDIRIIVIRMVDSLQDLRRAAKLPRDMQIQVAYEAMHIYAPLANRLGIWHLKWQLEDSAFSFLEPEKYREIARRLDDNRELRSIKVERAAARLRKRLADTGLKTTVTGRSKHIYSIYRKMVRKNLGFDQIYDIQALRVIIEPPIREEDEGGAANGKDKKHRHEREDLERDLCYQVLGAVHSLWQPIRGEFDDYIGSPKPNGYKSLHTAVIDSESGQKLEVQIRTQRMDEEAERGIASHWAYKEQKAKVSSSVQKQIQNLRELLFTLQEDEDDIDSVTDVGKMEERIHVFTPTGKVIDLPAGSTPIDFAYQIHTDLGHLCRGARVNGKLTSLDYQLQSGDKVEIIKGKRGGPNRDWMNSSLGFTRSSRTRSKIRQWFRQQEREQNIAQGREVILRELKRLGLPDVYSVEDIAHALKYDDIDEFLAKVGFGDIQSAQIAGAIAVMQQSLRGDDEDLLPLFTTPSRQRKGLTIHGVEGLYTRMAKCCNPIAPEPIVGYITRGQGVTIHAQNCEQLKTISEKERLIEVDWGTDNERYPIPIVVTAYRRGTLIEDMVNTLRGRQINVPKTKLVTVDNIMKVYLIAEVADINQLNWLLAKLENLPKVIKAQRQSWS